MTAGDSTSGPALLGRARVAGRSVGTVWSIARERVVENPTLFVAQVAARVPHSVSQRVTRTALAGLRGRGPSAARMLCYWLTGDRDRAVAEATAASRPGIPPRVRRRVATVALAFDDPALAASVVSDGEGGTSSPAMSARIAWSTGDVDAAVAAAASGRDRDSRRLAERLSGEVALLDGSWADRHRGGGAPVPAGGRPRTVLHLVTNSLPHTRSGYTIRTHRIAVAQRERGMAAHAVTRIGYPASIGSLVSTDRDVVDGIAYRRLLSASLPIRADARLDRQTDLLVAEIERVRPSVLHTTTHYVNGLSALAAARRTGLPLVYEARGFLEESWVSRQPDAERAAESRRFALWRERETACMAEADLVVTLGEVMKDEIVRRGIDPEKVVVVPNAVDESFLTPPPDRARTRAELGVADDEVLVGTVTSVVGYEGLDTLVDAVVELRGRGVPVRLLVVGDGVARPALERRARALGAAVTFTGRVAPAEVRRHHAALDVFVVPRRDERVCRLVTPLKPVEAMASGLPVVASDLPALSELVRHEESGLLVPPERPDALARALQRLAADPRLRSSLGAAGREHVAGRRTWSRVAAQYDDIYARVAGESRWYGPAGAGIPRPEGEVSGA
ncbi:MAG TPA: glycosyltransferase family 4 protein [Mycobacteriales bacterium]